MVVHPARSARYSCSARGVYTAAGYREGQGIAQRIGKRADQLAIRRAERYAVRRPATGGFHVPRPSWDIPGEVLKQPVFGVKARLTGLRVHSDQ